MQENFGLIFRALDIFYFFSSKRGKGVRGAGGGGGSLFIENPRRGVLQEGEGPRGQEGVCGELGNGGGGGLIFFFRGRNVHQEKAHAQWLGGYEQ